MNPIDPYSPPKTDVSRRDEFSPASVGVRMGLLFALPFLLIAAAAVVSRLSEGKPREIPFVLMFAPTVLVIVGSGWWWATHGLRHKWLAFLATGILLGLCALAAFMGTTSFALWLDTRQRLAFTARDVVPTAIAAGVMILWIWLLGVVVRRKVRKAMNAASTRT